MRILVWSVTALFAAGWTGMVWVAHQLTGWLLGAMGAGGLKEAGGAVAALPLPPELAPWIDTAWLGTLQGWASGLLGWLGAVLPSGDALMAWLGPLLWAVWGVGLLTLLAVAGLLHWAVGRGPALSQTLQSVRA